MFHIPFNRGTGSGIGQVQPCLCLRSFALRRMSESNQTGRWLLYPVLFNIQDLGTAQLTFKDPLYIPVFNVFFDFFSLPFPTKVRAICLW